MNKNLRAALFSLFGIVVLSAVSAQEITRNNDIIVEAKVHLVFVNKEGKPKKIPEDIYIQFKPYFCDSVKS